VSTETSSAAATGIKPRPPIPQADALGRLVLPAALLLIGILGHLAVPAGPARAILMLPCLFWIPGRSIAAGIGIGPKVSGQFLLLLSAMLSLVALILGGLVANAILGHVPLSTLPLWLSGILLPLGVLERDERTGLRAALPGLGFAALFTAAFVASGALLWAAVAHLPTTRQSPYLTFSLSGSYAKVQGVMTATAGQTLEIPVAVGGGGDESTAGLTVATYVDGSETGSAVPVATIGQDDATAQVSVTVPAATGCPHQIRLILERGATQLRAVDLYVQTGNGQGCGG